MADKIIEIRNLDFSIEDKNIFNDLSLNIKGGSFTTIIGPTGCGKSTLAKIIIGHINSKSFVKVDGQFINQKNIKEIRKKIGYVSENVNNLLVCDKVIDNFKFYVKKNNIQVDDIDIMINDVVKELNIEKFINESIKRLSAGEKQLIVLICVLLQNPRILILDEVLSILDFFNKRKILSYLKKLNKRGMTIINFTQDSEILLDGSDIIILNKGKVLLNMETNRAFENHKLFTDNKISLPFVVDLSIKLRYYQVIDSVFLDSKKMVDYLWK